MIRHIALVALLLCSATVARALDARDTADVAGKGKWSVGVFNPARYGLTESIELETHPLIFLTGSPNVTARIAHKKGTALRLTGEYGLSLPTFGMRLTKGYLYPTWETSGRDVGWTLVPSAGLVLSGGEPAQDVWSARLDAAVGLPLTDNAAAPLDTWIAPLEMAFAPVTTGLRVRLGGAWDKSLTERLRLRIEGNAYVTGTWPAGIVGPAKSGVPIFLNAHAGLDVGVGKSSRFTVGLAYWNLNTHKRVLVEGADGFSTYENARSHVVLPTIDFIWSGGGQ